MSTNETSKERQSAYAIRAAFDRAEREALELQRLRASGLPYSGLEFNPELLGLEPRPADGVQAGAMHLRSVVNDESAVPAERQLKNDHTQQRTNEGARTMTTLTDEAIGIKPDHNAVPTPDGGANGPYNADLSGLRKTSKSATYPWTADKPVSAKSVKRSGVKPLD
jgi:hypothetical protein